jgi:hypothetical protein
MSGDPGAADPVAALAAVECVGTSVKMATIAIDTIIPIAIRNIRRDVDAACDGFSILLVVLIICVSL